MTIVKFIKQKGLTVRLVAQQMKVTRQALSDYGKRRIPTARTLVKIATAMTELGVPTTAVEVFQALDEE